jgi:hypothetical protein
MIREDAPAGSGRMLQSTCGAIYIFMAAIFIVAWIRVVLLRYKPQYADAPSDCVPRAVCRSTDILVRRMTLIHG